MKSRPSMEKRRKELQRQERKQRKAERREQRKREKLAGGSEPAQGEDPNLADIATTSQPPDENTDRTEGSDPAKPTTEDDDR